MNKYFNKKSFKIAFLFPVIITAFFVSTIISSPVNATGSRLVGNDSFVCRVFHFSFLGCSSAQTQISKNTDQQSTNSSLSLKCKILRFFGKDCQDSKPSISDSNLSNGTSGSTTKTETTTVPPTSNHITTAGNPFGVMLNISQLGYQKTIQAAKNLGVAYIRPEAIRLSTWNGSCSTCDSINASGLNAIPTIGNSGGGGVASAPPSDINVFKQKLSEVLDKYPFSIVFIENEENSTPFYSGTPEQYGTELKAACEVAHSKGLKCSNGGLVSKLVALLTYNNYLDQGNTAKANDFAARAFDPSERSQLNSPAVKAYVKKGEALIDQDKAAGADYLNFHWYIPDTQALQETVAYLRERSGLVVITNEVGQQKNTDPQQVTGDLTTLTNLNIPFILWFSEDVNVAEQAKALNNSDGSLRPNGEAFKSFVASYNPK